MVEKNFSRYARSYDKYADIQYELAQRLIGLSPSGGITDILELGCGTGNYTYLLRRRFAAARIKALDISKGMIEVAREKLKSERIEFITADAEEIDLDGTFDFVTSNAAFQWFNNTEEALKKYRAVIRDEGIVLFSSFGPKTLFELSQSLKETVDKDTAISSENFLGKEELKEMLKRYFARDTVKELIIKKGYSSLMELLNKIKYTGTKGRGITNASLLWKKDMLKSIEKVYKSRFGRIEATYQIFFCRAVK